MCGESLDHLLSLLGLHRHRVATTIGVVVLHRRVVAIAVAIGVRSTSLQSFATEFADLRLQFVDPFLQGFHLRRWQGGQCRCRVGQWQLQQCGGVTRPLRADPAEVRVHVAEDTGQRVVIFLCDGLEFVIVTASAGHRDTQNATRGDVDLFVDQVRSELPLGSFVKCLGAQGQESRGDQLLLFLRFVARR